VLPKRSFIQSVTHSQTKEGRKMEIKQFVNAGHVARVLVYDRHPSGACINLTMQNGDEVTLYAGEEQVRDLTDALDAWWTENSKKVEEKNA